MPQQKYQGIALFHLFPESARTQRDLILLLLRRVLKDSQLVSPRPVRRNSGPQGHRLIPDHCDKQDPQKTHGQLGSVYSLQQRDLKFVGAPYLAKLGRTLSQFQRQAGLLRDPVYVFAHLLSLPREEAELKISQNLTQAKDLLRKDPGLPDSLLALRTGGDQPDQMGRPHGPGRLGHQKTSFRGAPFFELYAIGQQQRDTGLEQWSPRRRAVHPSETGAVISEGRQQIDEGGQALQNPSDKNRPILLKQLRILQRLIRVDKSIEEHQDVQRPQMHFQQGLFLI